MPLLRFLRRRRFRALPASGGRLLLVGLFWLLLRVLNRKPAAGPTDRNCRSQFCNSSDRLGPLPASG
eukprot:8754178-Pyramimonas_sp.AAC.1